MTETTTSLTTPVPAADVWEALADFGGIAQWAPNVDHSCLMSAQVTGVGAVRRIQSGRRTLVERVDEWVPGERLGYVIEGLPAVIRSVHSTWQVEDVGTSTMVSLISTVDVGPRPPHKLIGTALARLLSSTADKMLGGLDAHLQGAAR